MYLGTSEHMLWNQIMPRVSCVKKKTKCECFSFCLVSIWVSKSGFSVKQKKILVWYKLLPSLQHWPHQVWRKMFFPKMLSEMCYSLLLLQGFFLWKLFGALWLDLVLGMYTSSPCRTSVVILLFIWSPFPGIDFEVGPFPFDMPGLSINIRYSVSASSWNRSHPRQHLSV